MSGLSTAGLPAFPPIPVSSKGVRGMGVDLGGDLWGDLGGDDLGGDLAELDLLVPVDLVDLVLVLLHLLLLGDLWGNPVSLGGVVGPGGGMFVVQLVLTVGTVQPGLVLQLALTTWGTGLPTLSVSAWVGSGSSLPFPVPLRL